MRLLSLLVMNQGHVVSHEQIARAMFGTAHGPHGNRVAQYIHSLRGKIEPDPGHPRYVRTRYGLGYYFGLGDIDNTLPI
jgi:DNA-binding response OmpR family regulator